MPFIVLEGVDGSGKSTQLGLLRKRLSEEGLQSEYLHFPRFDTPVWGDLIGRFLRGELGAVDAVNPYLVALLFAGDRAAAATTIRGWLNEGRWVVLDRYVYSNVAFQCAKLPAGEPRNALRRWILDLEFVQNAIPRPDLSLFLDVPFSFTEKRLRGERTGADRDYLQGGRDIHEESLTLQQRVREVYLETIGEESDLKVVSCADQSGNMAPAEEIFERIMKEISRFL